MPYLIAVTVTAFLIILLLYYYAIPLVRYWRRCNELSFNRFIIRVIMDFERQADNQHQQFAVLLFIGEPNLDKIGDTQFVPQDQHGNPVVDNAYRYQPHRTRYGNYVVARPGQGLHAEVTLLQELEHLWDAYISQNHQPPSRIILYSWLLPCLTCTNGILEKVPNMQYRGTPVMIAYTTTWRKCWRLSILLNLLTLRPREVRYPRRR